MKPEDLKDETDRKHAERSENRNRARTYTYRSHWPEGDMCPSPPNDAYVRSESVNTGNLEFPTGGGDGVRMEIHHCEVCFGAFTRPVGSSRFLCGADDMLHQKFQLKLAEDWLRHLIFKRYRIYVKRFKWFTKEER